MELDFSVSASSGGGRRSLAFIASSHLFPLSFSLAHRRDRSLAGAVIPQSSPDICLYHQGGGRQRKGGRRRLFIDGEAFIFLNCRAAAAASAVRLQRQQVLLLQQLLPGGAASSQLKNHRPCSFCVQKCILIHFLFLNSPFNSELL